MHKSHLSVAALAVCAACSPLSLYYKQGVSVQSAEDAHTSCKIAAAKDVPVKQITRVVHHRPIPPRTLCTGDGKCITKPPIYFPPDYITEDANDGLRKEAVDLCMRKKGYQFVTVPACKPDAAPKLIRQTQRLPQLSSNSCVARGQSGIWQIITP